MSELNGFDAYSPREIAMRVETVGVTKARMATLPLLMLGMLAGAFIGLGALFFVLVKSDATLSFAVSQVLGGVVFSLGLLLVMLLFSFGENLEALAYLYWPALVLLGIAARRRFRHPWQRNVRLARNAIARRESQRQSNRHPGYAAQ